jgi:4-amino-4-deoxy-L-arabinose transferase-like glycosyltransferase
LLFAGFQCWIVLGRAQFGEKRQVLAALLCGIVGAVLGARPAVLAWLDGISQPSPRVKRLSFIAITVLATLYLYATARLQHRDLSPIVHDEHVYWIQARMLAAGRLWLPRHDLAEFLDSFHLITDRVYASKYGPGAAIFFAPAALLGLPTWLTPLLLSGLAVGLIYLLATELFDNLGGYLAALMLLSLGVFRRTSTMVMSQAPMLVLALLALLALVQWRRDRRLRWVAVMGACVGCGAITRPVDAVCIALPLGSVVLFDLVNAARRAPQAGRLNVARVALVGMVAIAPFVLLQVICNKGLTGKWTDLPWSYYARLNDPYDTMGKVSASQSRIAPALPQKRQFIDEFTRPAYEQRVGTPRLDRLEDRTTRTLTGPELREQLPSQRVYGTLPSPLLIALLPLGLLAMSSRSRWVVWAALPPFLLIYSQYNYFFPHYAVAIAPAVIVNALAAIPAIQSTWPRARWITPALACLLAGIGLFALPELNPSRKDQWFDAPLLRDVDRRLTRLDHTPAVVLFRYDPERLIHEEPVYNLQSARPEGAKVMRAHDLGDAANRKIFTWFAARQPDRAFYHYDEAAQTLTYLGTAKDLAK